MLREREKYGETGIESERVTKSEKVGEKERERAREREIE